MFKLSGGLFLFLILLFLVSIVHLTCWGFFRHTHFSGMRSWVGSFECGFLGQGMTESSFSFTYFVLLVFFVIFDLEISLLLNVCYQGILYKNLMYYLFFILSISLGFTLEIVKGYASWSS